jgi:GNAT superfamily N-acetyltransferase
MATSALKLRKAQDEDWEDILEADKICFPHDTRPWQDDFWWILEDEHSSMAAYAGARRSYTLSNGIYLSRAGVLPEYRGQRLQRRMVRARERWARGQGFDQAITDTYCNPISMNTLIRCGYRTFQPFWDWGHEGTVYWTRKL